MTAAHSRTELHELINRVEEQVGELRRRTLRLARSTPDRLRVLESVDGPPSNPDPDLVRAGSNEDDTEL